MFGRTMEDRVIEAARLTGRRRLLGRLLLSVAAGLFVLLFSLLVHAAENVRLEFKAEVEVDGPELVLGDLLVGLQGASQALAEQIRALPVGESPEPGQSKIIHDRQINGLLTFNDLGLTRIQAHLPRRIIVKRPAQRLDRDRLLRAFEEAVMASLAWLPDEVRISDLKAPEVVLLPRGDLDIDILPPARNSMPGRVAATAEIRVDGRVAKRLKLLANVDFYQNVVLAVRPLDKGEVVEAADVRLDLMPIRREPAQLINSIDEAVGLCLRTPARAGQPLRSNQLVKPTLVKRGDKVTIVASRGALTIRAAGMIQDQKAARGDQVSVLNLSTRRNIIAQVVDANTVRVMF